MSGGREQVAVRWLGSHRWFADMGEHGTVTSSSLDVVVDTIEQYGLEWWADPDEGPGVGS